MATTGIIDGVKAVKPLVANKTTDITDQANPDGNALQKPPATISGAPGTNIETDPATELPVGQVGGNVGTGNNGSAPIGYGPGDPQGLLNAAQASLNSQGAAKPTVTTPSTTQPTPAPVSGGDGSPGSPTPGQPAVPSTPAGAPPATGTPAPTNGQAWSPTSGIVDQIKQADVATTTGTGYTAATGGPAQGATASGYDATGAAASLAPDAKGYTATGYTPETTADNLSSATAKVMGNDSEVLQRARAMSDVAANSKGILNSTMATQSGTAAVLDKATQIGAGDVAAQQFNVQAKNAASAFLADASNQAAQFKAMADNQNGMFNAQQSQQATQYTATAKNTADQMLAAAKNTASMFTSAEANKQSQFAVTQLNQAAQFAAQMDAAAKSQNATAFNQAHQRYADAMNAAIAAQNDAENLARRDTAQLAESHVENQERVQGQVASASIGANATMGAAQLASQDRASALKEQARQFGVTMDERQTEFVAGLSASQFNSFQQGLTTGMTAQLEPEARQNFLHNYMSVWAASGSLPFTIDTTQFPAAGATPP